MLCLNDGQLKHCVELIDQQPRSTVGHSHHAAGRRDRAVITDGFQQPDLAVSDGLIGAEIQAQCEPDHSSDSSRSLHCW